MRLNRKDFFMKLAYTYAEQSTCCRRKVGAIIVRDNRELSAGYNGAPPGIEHCTPETCIRTKLNIPSGERQELCITGDTIIKLLDGTYKTIKELADKGEDFWLYSIDINTGEIVPGYAINPHLTGYRDDIVEITFDNGKTLKCTSDHKILLRDCTYKKAKDLIYGDSCMPIYYNKGKNNNSHEVIRNTRPDSKNFKWDSNWKCNTNNIKTHEMVYRNFNNFFEPLGKNQNDIHHQDENKYNNAPENLKLKTKSEHMHIHGGFKKLDKESLKKISLKGTSKIIEKSKIDDNFRKKLSNGGKKSMTNNWNNPIWRKKALIRCKENLKKGNIKSNKDPIAIEARKKGNILSGLSFLLFKCKENNINITINNYNELQQKYCPKFKLGEKGARIPKIDKILDFYDSLETAIEDAKYYNHKVVSVKYLNNKNVPVYDLSVMDFGNFAIDLGDNSCVVISNCMGGHAEQNAIANAAENGVAIKGSTLYCTTFPCAYCSKAIVRAGIIKVIYCEGYPDEISTKILKNIIVEKYEKQD